MEFMPGGSLADRIARGPLSAGEVIRIGLEIIEPLAYTHELGIVHRDIKPGNILFNAEGHAILADFGIASRLDGQEVRPDEDLIAITTSLSVPAGTIEYASPEQLQGFPSGPEADLWSLGVTLWHMVTGHSPFRTGNVFQTMFAIVSGGTEVPEELGEFRFLIRSLLSRDPGERMTAAAVEVELRRLWTAAGSGSPTGPPGPPAPPAPPVRPAVRPQPREGDVLAGRYALNHVVSTSGAEVRWEAFDNVLLRHVVAVTPRELATGTEEDSQEPRDRFLRTARVLSQIHHPSVQSIYDVLDHHDRPWAIMELVEGRTLREIITWGPVGLRTTARIGVNVLEALDHIHRTGSVHRDIKPQNIIVAESDEVFLTGFEIARPFNEPPITQTGFAVGSPQYIAPESILGNDEGPAVDVWCLGLTLLAAATGSPPFFGNDSPLQIIRSILEDPIEIPSELGPLRPVLLGMLNKDPSQRPTVEDVQAALLDALNQLP
jgi:serine/threonine protein kinase